MKARNILYNGLLFAFLCCICTQLQAQRNIYIRNILNDKDIRCFAIDNQNCMWAGASDGLYMINNSVATAYNTIMVDNQEISLYDVSSLVCLNNKVIFTTLDHLMLFDKTNQTFSPILINNYSYTPTAMTIYDNQVYMYFPAISSLILYNPATLTYKTVHTFSDAENYLFTSVIVCPDKPNIIFLSENARGVFQFNLNNSTISKIDSIQGDIDADKTVICHSELWVTPINDGVKCYSIDNSFSLKAHYNQSSADYPLTSNVVTCIAYNQQTNNIIIGTDGGGISIFNLENGRLTDVIDNYNLLSTTFILPIDNNHIVCGISRNGIADVKKNFTITLSKNSDNENTVLSSNNIMSILQDDYESNVIWLGTEGHGINKYVYAKDATEKDYVKTYLLTNSLKVSSMANIDKDHLLVLFKNNGLILFNKNDGTFEKYDLPFIQDELYKTIGFSNLKIVGIGDGNILVINANGTNYHYSTVTGQYQEFEVLPKDSKDWIRLIHNNQYHTVFQTQNSLFEINNRTLKCRTFYISDQIIETSTLCSDGSVFFVEKNNTYRYNPSKNETTLLYSLNDEENRPKSICVHSDGTIWSTMSDGNLFSYDLKTQNKLITSKSHFGSNSFTSDFALASGNKLFFSGSSGVLVVEPDHKSIVQETNFIQIFPGKFFINGKPYTKDPDKKIKIKNNDAIDASFIVNSNNPLDEITIKTVITHNGTTSYGEQTSKTSIHLEHLSKGSYTIKVRPLSSTGWMEPIKVYSFTVINSPFVSWWAILLYILLGLVIMYTILKRNKHNQLQHENDIKQQLITKRYEERISQITSIVHDLRSPMSIVQNRVQLAVDNLEDNKSVQKKVIASLQQIEKMTTMINNILSMQKNGSVSETMTVKFLCINDWIARSLAVFRISCAEKGLSLKFSPDLSISYAVVDETLFEACFRNLLTNAIKYSDSGTITVFTQKNGEFLRISVSDQGRGFSCPAEDLFSKYYRDKSNIKSAQGYGIGLAYVKEIMEKMGGHYNAEHNADVGSTFWFEFPLNENTITEKEDNSATQKYSVMIIDTEYLFPNDVTDKYKQLFKHVHFVTDTTDIIQNIVDTKPDVIICSKKLNNNDGLEICHNLKNNVLISHIPFVLFAQTTKELNHKSPALTGPDITIALPFEPDSLHSAIQDSLVMRESVIEKFKSGSVLRLTAQDAFSIADVKLIQDVNKIITSNKQNLTPELIATALCIDVQQLDEKLQALGGVSIQNFIKRIENEKEEY